MSTARQRARNTIKRWVLPAAVLTAACTLLLSTTIADAHTYATLPSFAGYIVGKQDPRANFANYAEGDFTVPTITCSTKNDVFAQWAGFGVDGVTPPETLVQAGIVAGCENGNKPHIRVFNEVRLPNTPFQSNNGVEVQPTNMVQVIICPSQGKVIDKQGHYDCATNAPARTNYYIEIRVMDRFERLLGDYSRLAPAMSSRAHAECLVEAPNSAGTYNPRPMAKFTTAAFGLCGIGYPVPAGTGIRFVDLTAGSAGYSSTKYDMRTSPPNLRFRASTSEPSGFPGGGDGFNVTWLSH